MRANKVQRNQSLIKRIHLTGNVVKKVQRLVKYIYGVTRPNPQLFAQYYLEEGQNQDIYLFYELLSQMQLLDGYGFDDEMSEKCQICDIAHIKYIFYIQHRQDQTKGRLRVGSCCIKVMEDWGLIDQARLNQNGIKDLYCCSKMEDLLEVLNRDKNKNDALFVQRVILRYEKKQYPTVKELYIVFLLFEEYQIHINQRAFSLNWRIGFEAEEEHLRRVQLAFNQSQRKDYRERTKFKQIYPDIEEMFKRMTLEQRKKRREQFLKQMNEFNVENSFTKQ